MKEDSLLSSLSNMSYQNRSNHSDFFHDSMPFGDYNEMKTNKGNDHEEVNLNSIENFTKNDWKDGKNNLFLAVGLWNVCNDPFNKNENNGSEFGCSDIENEEEIIEDAEKEPRTKEIDFERKNSKMEDSSSEGSHIGTIVKNETKNIPKNYGKAIITYIEKEKEHFMPILEKHGIKYKELMDELSKKKKNINTIANLRDLWVDFKYSRCMRILSNQFLRKHALQYIFNSRISNFTSHVKYRKRLQEAIETPISFRHIKEY